MAEYTQKNRLIEVITPLGEDALLLRGFAGQEGVSRLFQFDLEMLSETETVDFDQVVGQETCVRMLLPGGDYRYFHGIVSTFSEGGAVTLTDGRTPAVFTEYRATIVPWLWLLTRSSNCRIFQEKSVPDIVQKVFSDAGFQHFELRLHGSYPTREYCVQYRETDFNFVSRLLEEEGIYYFFEHTFDRHTLILTNDPSEFKPCPNQSTVSYTTQAGEDDEDDVVNRLTMRKDVRSGQYVLRDYNFEQPGLDLTATLQGSPSRPYQIYDYPGEYRAKGDGDRLARVRMECEDAAQVILEGASSCTGLIPGFKFELENHFRADMNQSYALLSVSHSCMQGDNFRSQRDQASAAFEYANRFECLPATATFRPARITPVPLVHGSQTAVVVGPKGEEIFVDKHGRVKVQFHWDRDGKFDDKSSCWIRVSQNWAGKRWGAIFLPRIGQEVIVDFLEGDPDQPIIVGRVYNGENMPPYTLPDDMTKSAIKSYSSKGGGGFNELRFEDKKGSEQLFMHAEKDQDNRVKHDSSEWVGRNRNLIVQSSQFELVGGDKHLKVKGDHNEEIVGAASLKVGTDHQLKAGMKYALEAGQEIHLKSGLKMILESGVQLTLKVGGNFIDINPAGVFISGTMVMINSGGSAGSGSGSSPQPPKGPREADKAQPGQMSAFSQASVASSTPTIATASFSPQAKALIDAAESGTPFCERCAAAAAAAEG